MSALLSRHAPDSAVCFGVEARGAAGERSVEARGSAREQSVEARSSAGEREADAGGSSGERATEGARDAAQLAAYARAIAASLPEARSGARVVLACSDRYHFSAGLLAIWLRGYTAELPPNGQPGAVHALADASGVIALLHDREGGVGVDVRALERPQTRASLPLTPALGPEEPAIVAYTSGSTGEPVAHVKSLAQLLREPEAHLAGFDLAGRRIVAAVPPYHIYGLLFGVLVPLLGGGSMSRSAPLHPSELLHELARAGADVLIAVPPHLNALAALGADDAEAWPRLHRVFSSAAPLPAATSELLAARGMTVTEILGSTETGGIAQRTRTDEPWQPLPSVRVEIDDEAALWVDSPWLAPSGPRPVRTADRVEAAAGGGFRHLGRSDAVVKIGGRRIDLGELETRLKAHPEVRDARVLAVEGGGVRGLSLLAVLESDHVDVAELKRTLASHVDPVAVPRRFRVVPRMPRSPTGKLARHDLLALFAAPARAEGNATLDSLEVSANDVSKRALARASEMMWTFPAEALADGCVRFAVPEQSGFFRGHFDGQPILPGVAQLQHLALSEARRRFPDLGQLTRMTRVKFKRLIAPGETLVLSLVRKGEHAVQFALDAEGEPAASGLFHFGVHAREQDGDAGGEP